MAEHGATEIATATGPDYADHVRTYEGFLHLTRYATAGIVIVLILMALFVA